MSQIGGPIQSGLAGGVPAQDVASKARAKRERERADKTRRFEDAVDLTVPGMESSEAIHPLSKHDEEEHQRPNRKAERQDPKDQPAPDDATDGPHIDLRG